MQQSVLRYAGTYRFHHRSDLEHAIHRARQCINEDQDLAALGGGWLRCFVMFGTTLTVNVAVPAEPEHRAAADSVFAALGAYAVECALSTTISDSV